MRNDYQPNPKCSFIEQGPKNDSGQFDPPASCVCGATMPEGIKTSPHGWFYGHVNFGWGLTAKSAVC